MINNSIAKIDSASVSVSFKSSMMEKTRFRHAAELMKNNSIIIEFASSRRRLRRRRESSLVRNIFNTSSNELNNRFRSLQSSFFENIEKNDSLFLFSNDEFRSNFAENLDVNLKIQNLNENDEDFDFDQNFDFDDNAFVFDDLKKNNVTRHSSSSLSRIKFQRRCRDQAIKKYANVFSNVAVFYNVNRIYDVIRIIMFNDNTSQIRSRSNEMFYKLFEKRKRRRLRKF